MAVMSLAYIRAMQADCRDRYLADGDTGALLGLSDWQHEEMIFDEERSSEAETQPPGADKP